MTWFVRRLFELFRIHKRVLILPEEYAEFWQSRCWLALRHEVAARLDHYLGVLIAPEVTERQVWECRGAIFALHWILDAEEEMNGRIAQSVDKAMETQRAESRLREVLQLMAEEMADGKRRSNSKSKPESGGSRPGPGQPGPSIQLKLD